MQGEDGVKEIWLSWVKNDISVEEEKDEIIGRACCVFKVFTFWLSKVTSSTYKSKEWIR